MQQMDCEAIQQGGREGVIKVGGKAFISNCLDCKELENNCKMLVKHCRKIASFTTRREINNDVREYPFIL